jgi:gluconate 2-dehydrogenase gamma chain
MSRRGFVAAGALAAQWRPFFAASDAALIEAITAQIIPADQDPGAREAGVIHYIDRQLAGPLKRFAPVYRKGIPAFQQACLKLTGKPFLELSFDDQTEFLQRIDGGEVKEAASFFQLLIDHTMQGYYGSPKHGGNRGEASWKMLKIEDIMREDSHSSHTGGRP